MDYRTLKSAAVRKRSLTLSGHKTSLSLEDAFWSALKDIAAKQQLTLGELVDRIDAERNHPNLSSAVRIFVFNHYRDAVRSVEKSHGGNGEDRL